jgi:hypothetical protein
VWQRKSPSKKELLIIYKNWDMHGYVCVLSGPTINEFDGLSSTSTKLSKNPTVTTPSISNFPSIVIECTKWSYDSRENERPIMTISRLYIYQKLADGVSDFIYYPFNFVSSLSFLQHQVMFSVLPATEFLFLFFILELLLLLLWISGYPYYWCKLINMEVKV